MLRERGSSVGKASYLGLPFLSTIVFSSYQLFNQYIIDVEENGFSTMSAMIRFKCIHRFNKKIIT